MTAAIRTFKASKLWKIKNIRNGVSSFTITKDFLCIYLIYFKQLIFLAGRGLNF